MVRIGVCIRTRWIGVRQGLRLGLVFRLSVGIERVVDGYVSISYRKVVGS